MKDKKGLPAVVVLILIFVVAVIGAISFVVQRYTPTKEQMDKNEYYGIAADDEVALVVNGQVSETKGKVIDGSVYIDYDSVTNFINSRFYWDQETNTMIYALPTEIVETDLNQESTDYRVIDGQLYLSVAIVQEYTDMDCTILENPYRLVIRNQWDGLRQTTVVKDTAVRYRGGIKSLILTEVSAGTSLVVTDESLGDWIGVTTEDGYTGYIDTEDAGEVIGITLEHTPQGPVYTNISRDEKINMVFHQTTSQAANEAVDQMLETVSGVNVIAPTWYFIDDTAGNLYDLSSYAYVENMHNRGIEVWAVLNDFDGGIASRDETLTVLKNTASRRNIIQTLMNSVLANGIDGVNVDIEKVSGECAPHYLQFIRELSVSCRNNGIILSIDNYVPQDYSIYYNRKEQGIVADYLVIMGYDEHFGGSETAGSVASLPFVEDGIIRTLEEVPAEKVINAIPFYTRIWKTDNSGVVSSTACGMDEAEAFVAENGLEKYWDTDTSQNYTELQTEDGYYQVWLEDGESIEEKMKLIRNYGLAGVAQWKLGFEQPYIWEIISSYL